VLSQIPPTYFSRNTHCFLLFSSQINTELIDDGTFFCEMKKNQVFVAKNCRYFQKFIPGNEFGKKYHGSIGTNVADTVRKIVENDPNILLPELPNLKNRFITSPKSLIIHDVSLVVRQLQNNQFLEKSGG
jgi:hypothetical protein